MINNFIDVLILSIIVISTLFGFFLGFIVALILLIIIIFYNFFTTIVLPQTFIAFSSFITNPLAQIFFFVIVFFLLIIAYRVLFYKFLPSSIFNRVLGGILGFFSGIFLNHFVLKIIMNISYFKDEIINSSLTSYVLQFSKNFLL